MVAHSALRGCAVCNQPALSNHGACRPGLKEPEDGASSDEHPESSDEDMEWSGNNSLYANLSIPQLDGAADESSGE